MIERLCWNPYDIHFKVATQRNMAERRKLTIEQIVQSMQNLSENESDNAELGEFISDNSTDEDFHPSISSENDSDLDIDNEVTS